MIFGELEDEEAKIVEFNTKDGKVVSEHSVDFSPGDFESSFEGFLVESIVVLVWMEEEYWDSVRRRVIAYNLQTRQVIFNEVYHLDYSDCYHPVYNERTKEIQVGIWKFKISEDSITEEIVESCPPDIVALNSNLFIAETCFCCK